jgi:hypothetical protein
VTARGVPAEVVLRLAEVYRCPDCDSEVSLSAVDGVLVLHVAHDESCPEWQRRQRERSA